MVVKLCTKCKVSYSADLKYFAPDKRLKSGLQSICRLCQEKWRKSPNGQKYTKKYNRSDKARVVRKKYKDSDKGQRNRKEYELNKFYGITIDYYNKMFVLQLGCCKICRRHQSELKETLCVDHDHVTGKVRGLLCSDCNLKLRVVEDVDYISKARKYLRSCDD